MSQSREKSSSKRAKPSSEPTDMLDTVDGIGNDRIRNVTLYSGARCARSHRIRLVLAEKDITIETRTVDPANLPEDLLAISPYHELPVLADRGLVLYHVDIMAEYLDERFPHPPLMPVDPVNRAQARLQLRRLDRDLYPLLDTIERGGRKKEADEARVRLRDELSSISPLFQQHPFVFGDTYSLVDCTLAPLLWRLPVCGIELPSAARALLRYADRLFARPAFIRSLTEREVEMRAPPT